MLENCKTARERWGGVSVIIDRWLQERQDLLVLFCALSETSSTETQANRLPQFFQILVDYVSAGHFEVYEQLVQEGREFDDQEGLRESESLFDKIQETTDALLDLNDKYQETDDLDALKEDLSKLGEYLESRFELEDRIIEVLHVSHRDQVTG
ncbi:MAG: sigma D regulator [Marinagarivorans sp.]